MIDINKLIMNAMISKDNVALDTYRLLKSRIIAFQTSKNAKPYTESEEINQIKKMIEDRNESAQIYIKNNRKDLADRELKEASILTELLPKLPTLEDIQGYLNEHYPNGIAKREMGQVIKEVKNCLAGSDGKMVSSEVSKLIINQ